MEVLLALANMCLVYISMILTAIFFNQNKQK
jgi:hypothetical protein